MTSREPEAKFIVYRYVTNLKKLLSVLAALAAFAAAFSDGGRAFGQGVVEGGSSMGAHFKFNVRVPEDPTRPNRFHFHDMGLFVPLRIDVAHFREIRFGMHQAHFTGMGRLNGTHPVRVAVWVVDGGTQEPDRFRMVARNLAGVVIHTAQGDVIEGNLVVLPKP